MVSWVILCLWQTSAASGKRKRGQVSHDADTTGDAAAADSTDAPAKATAKSKRTKAAAAALTPDESSAPAKRATSAVDKKKTEKAAAAAGSSKKKAASTSDFVFLLTGSHEESAVNESIIEALGGKTSQSGRKFDQSSTHIICSELKRTEKFVAGCAAGKVRLRVSVRACAE